MSERTKDALVGDGTFNPVFAPSAASTGEKVLDLRRIRWPAWEMYGYQAPNTVVWTVTISEMFIELKTLDEFQFEVLFHWVQDSPIAAANDHNWPDDVSFTFNLFTDSGALITSFTHVWRRNCGKRLYEVPRLVFASQVAWPVRNLGYGAGRVQITGYHRQQVTGC